MGKYIYQAVHMIFDGNFDDQTWKEGEQRQNKLVFIGKNLNHDELRSGFAACLDSPENNERIKAIEEVKLVEQQISMLLRAAQRDDTPMLRQLIKAGIPVNSGNSMGQTALHVAALWGNVQSVEVLIAAGANLDIKNRMGSSTPLHATAMGMGPVAKRLQAAKKLIEAGADRRQVDDAGMMPYQLVKSDGKDQEAHMELCKLLNPETELQQDAPDSAAASTCGHCWTWTQNGDDVEITCNVKSDTRKTDVRVTIKKQELRIEVAGEVVCEGKLADFCDPEESTWTIEKGSIVCSLTKANPSKSWRTLFVS